MQQSHWSRRGRPHDRLVSEAVTEERLTTSDGTSYSKADLHERVSVIEDGIILIREVPFGTAETWLTMADRGGEIGRRFGKFCWVVDVTYVNERPKGNYLETIKNSLLDPDLVWLFLVIPVGAITRTVARFVVGMMWKRLTIVESVEEGIAQAREKVHE